MYILDKAVHINNRPAPPSQPLPQSYNPNKGCAYYFTPSGDQMCQMPNYYVSGKSKNPKYDDDPEVDRPCSKKFPSVSFGGFEYLFLVVLSNSWPFLRFSFDFRQRRQKGSFQFIVQVHGKGTQTYFL